MPQPLSLETPELQNNEIIKSFQSQDDLAKSYVELKGKVDSGDISLVPEDLRKDPTVSKYKNISELAKGHVEATKLVGGIKKAPETPDGYKFTPMTNLHKGVAIGSEQTQKALASLFHKAGLNSEQADIIQQGIFSGLSRSLQKNEELGIAKSKEVETALRAEWGADYDKNKNNIDINLKKMGLNKLSESANNDVEVLKEAHRLLSVLSEDTIGKLGSNTNTGNSTTKDGALTRIKEIMESPELRKKLAEGDKALTKEWTDLHATAYA